MTSVDFSNLLTTKLEDVKRPPVKPPGTYHGNIESYKFDKSSQKGTPYLRLTMNSVQPGEDVDPEALKDEDGKPIDFTKYKPTADFYLTSDALWRLSEFIAGFNLSNAAGRQMNELIPELRGMPVTMTLSLKASDDGKGFYNRVESIIASS